ncbi:MAG: LytR/AlgR family response regulator transcription factor [Candidatus Kapaibacterium sp.]
MIVDDEPYGRKTLHKLIQRHCPNLSVIGEAASVAEGSQIVNQADLVFLDIQMSDGTGFDLLQKASPINFEVIFVTAYDQYGIQAVKASAVDYLLKPVDVADLKVAVQNAVERHTLKKNFAKRGNDSELDPGYRSKRLILPNLDGFQLIDLEEVIRCRSHKNYTEFFLRGGKSTLVSKSIGEYESLLLASNFFRIHHSHIVNMAYIKGYKRGKGGSVIMVDGSEIPVSVRRKGEFLVRLMET